MAAKSLALSLSLLALASVAGSASAQGVASPSVNRSSDANRQSISEALVQVQKVQELFRGRQRVYARSLGQLGDHVTLPDSVVITLSGVSATGFVAMGRHLGLPAVECTLVMGDAPLPAGIPAREVGRPVCLSKKTPE